MSLKFRPEANHVFNTTPTAPGTVTIVTAVPNQIIKVYRFIITIGAVAAPPAIVQFNSSVAGIISQQFQLGATGQLVVPDGAANMDPLFSATVGEALQIQFSGGNLSWDVWYLQGV